MLSRFCLFAAVLPLFTIMPSDAIPFQTYYTWGLRGTLESHEVDDKKKKEVIHVKSVTKNNNNNNNNNNKDVFRDYEEAENALFHAVERVEKEFVKALEDEVDTLFHHHSGCSRTTAEEDSIPLNCSNNHNDNKNDATSSRRKNRVSSVHKNHHNDPKGENVVKETEPSSVRDSYVKALSNGLLFI